MVKQEETKGKMIKKSHSIFFSFWKGLGYQEPWVVYAIYILVQTAYQDKNLALSCV